jgi:NAD(P)-dependent dehydrogenase (short-subunit alcohol dehydrogenase family)
VVDEIVAAGGEAVADTHSVATPEGGEAIVATALEAFAGVHIVINNAGILRDKTFLNLTPEMVDTVIDVHLKGAFNVTRPAWAHMRAQGYGRVLNTSSNSGILGNFGQSNYGAAKMGLVGLTRVLAAEGAKYDIKVNALAPLAWTRMTEDVFGDRLGDRIRPELVTPAAIWLVHSDCQVSGEIYSAAGGRVARFFIGMTEGYYNPELTAEDVRDHFAEVRDETGYTVPADPSEEIALVAKLIGG